MERTPPMRVSGDAVITTRQESATLLRSRSLKCIDRRCTTPPTGPTRRLQPRAWPPRARGDHHRPWPSHEGIRNASRVASTCLRFRQIGNPGYGKRRGRPSFRHAGRRIPHSKLMLITSPSQSFMIVNPDKRLGHSASLMAVAMAA